MSFRTPVARIVRPFLTRSLASHHRILLPLCCLLLAMLGWQLAGVWASPGVFTGLRARGVALMGNSNLSAKRGQPSATSATPLLSANIVISQVYGGGGNTGATYTNDFIELFNRGNSSVSIAGWSVQYASATGTTWAATNLSGSIPAGGYYLIQEAVGAGGTTPLPTPNATGTIAMSGTAGKVALVNSTTLLSGSCPSSVTIIDLVGFGTTANCFEGAGPTPAPSNTTAVLRGANGCTETDTNSTDFSAGAPTPRNSATALAPCGGGGTETLSLSCTPSTFSEAAGASASTCTVTRTGSTTALLVVNLASNDTTEATVSAPDIGIPVGQASTTFTLNAVDDVLVDGTQTVTITASATNFTSGTFQVMVTDNDTPTLTAINAIQGAGTQSPLNGTTVSTRGIVTALRSNGFYLQTQTGSALDDNNTATSEGIFVFTSSAPPGTAALGNLVDVTGTVSEFISTSDICNTLTCAPEKVTFTELVTPTVSLISTGNTLPTPVALTATDMQPGGSIEQLEKYESMRVSVASLTVVAPTDGNVTETSATSASTGVFFAVITGTARPFREAGIEASEPPPSGGGTIPPIPRFDGNAERLRVDSDAQTGASVLNVTTGVTITNMVGVLDFFFRNYTLLPDPSSPHIVSSNLSATPLPDPTANEFTVASFNLERFFDTVNDGNGAPTLTATAFANRLNKASLAIRNILRTPDILGVVEVENLSTLQTLANKINTDAGVNNPQYVAYLSEGNDPGGIDVGFLVKTAIVVGATPRVTVSAVVQEGLTTTYTNPNTGAQDLLNDRPPLRLNAIVNHADGRNFPITVIVNHLRSLNGINDPTVSGSGTEGARVRAKRQAQAVFLANLIQTRQTNNPNERIIACGDFNAFEVNDGYADIINTILGTPSPDNQTVVPGDGADLVNPNLTDLIVNAASAEKYSYSFNGNAQAIDHLLASANLTPFLNSFRTGRIDADYPETFRNDSTRPERISDHDAPIAYFAFPTCPTINITPTSLAAGTAGSAYGPVNFGQTGGSGTILWSVPSNNLPAGLTLDPNTGVLSGTPTVAVGVNITIRATDQNNCFGERTITLQINCPTVTISPSSGSPTTLTSGTVGQAYSQTFTAAPAGGSYAYSIPLPSIPPGLTFNTATGVLSGTLSTVGTFTFTVTATGFGTCAGSQTYALPVIPACPSSFTVNDLSDAPDVNVGDRVCAAANGACTLRAAIQEANANPGCSPLTINFNVTGTITAATALPTITHPNLTINGPGAASLTVRAAVATTTIRVFDITGAGNSVTINGLTITGGNVTGLVSPDTFGGGLRNQGATVSVNNCVITANTAERGGGLVLIGGTLTLSNSTLSSNTATDEGGAVENRGGTLTASNSTFSANQSLITGAGADGGAYNSEDANSVFNASNCLFSGNTAGDDGGAVDNALGRFTITKCYFLNNTATDLAGALEDRSGNATNNTITGSTFSGNHAANDGGALFTRDSTNTLTVTNSTFNNNSAGGKGGVAYVRDAGDNLTLVNCTLSGNSSTLGVGGVALETGSATLRNTIIANNTGGNCSGTFAAGAANLEFPGATATCGSGTALGNPLLGTLQNNGGFNAGAPATQQIIPTMLLTTGSPALDAANVTFAPATDQRGVARPQGAGPDIGAVEGALPSITPVAVTRQQGSPASNSTIANVSDALQAANTLTVTVNGGATATVNGVTVSGLSINAQGVVTANVVATCSASNASFTLRVTNSLNAFSEATLNVTVTANTAPTLIYATPQNVAVSGALNVTPTTATDNGSITGYQIISVSPVLTTAPTVNASGVVAITSAFPTGNHVITVRATDNCGATTDATFTLNVNLTCPTQFTVNTLGDTADALAGDGVCADGSGNCSLRAAIMGANAITACSPLTINFSATGTINLTGVLPNLNHPNLTINGPGSSQLTVRRDTGGDYNIFAINSGRTVVINGLTIRDGNTTQGGGISNQGSLTLSDCVVTGNTATNGGGGLYNLNGSLTITGSTISNNNANSADGINVLGGGIASNGGSITLRDSTISGNRNNNPLGSLQGAAMNLANTTAKLTNCTISGHSAANNNIIISHAVSNSAPTLTLTNCTVTANNSTGNTTVVAGGFSGFMATVQLRNTLVAGNSGQLNFGTLGIGTVTSLGNNLDSDGSSGFTNGVNGDIVGTNASRINALLAPLANYGGATFTHALLPGSPAINAGNNCVLTNSCASNNLGFNLTTDQRGIARPQQTTVDIGAFESRGFLLAVAGGGGQSAFVSTAFVTPLAVTVTANNASEPVSGGLVTFTPPGSGASATLATSPATINGSGQASVTATANATVGGPYNVAANANGATPAVNFALTNTNPSPTITAGAALTRQQGTAASNATIATVNDPNQTAGTLTVTATTVPTGITVTNIVNTNGTITASVAAGCNAAVGANTIVLTVTDSFGATMTANLTVNVTANTAPTLAYTTPQSVVAAAALNVPVTTATDNGSITGYSIVSVTPALNTAPTVNSSGMVSITNAGQAGSHVITVQATDNCGATTNASFTLNVTCPVINATVAGGGAICPSGSSTVTVTITGGTAPYTVTLNNGGGTLTGASPLSFTVSPAATTTYSVQTATDANGCAVTATGSATVTVNTVTAINTQPQPQTVCAGTTATFSVVAAGTNLTYQWRKGGTPISGATNSTLSIPNAQAGDAGSYDVVVTGACGTVTSNAATLTVNPLTAITAQPANQAQTIGQSVTFSVVASGTSLTYQWRKGGTPISGATNSSFTIAAVAPGDAGNYDVVVTGTCGTATSNAATLTVNCQTITVTAPATNTGIVNTGFSATFTQTGGIGATTFSTASTLPNGLALSSGGVLSGTPTQTGTFPITVKATDSNNCMGTVNYTLTINTPPCAGLALNPASVPVGVKGAPYSVTFTAANANGAASFARTAGTLPPGLTLVGAVLSGTPTQAGSFDFTITVTDANNCTASVNYTLVVDAQSGSIGDPLICLGPGGLVAVEATVTNSGTTPQPVSFVATLPANLLALPNTCVATVNNTPTGTCTVDTANNRVNWNGTLNGNQTVTIRYQSQVGDKAVPGDLLCVNSAATINGAGPFTVQACTRVTCPPVGPGAAYPAVSPMSDQKAGSVLLFNLYTSSASGTGLQNTRLALTNVDMARTAYVHLFFVDGATCSVADSFICLTPNQTAAFLASDVDPGTTGYVIAVATDRNGCPINFNALIGDAFVRLSTGHAANLAAEAIAAIPGGFVPCDPQATTATLNFDNVMYNALPRVVALSNIGSRADSNSTLLVLNRIGGSLATGASTLVNVFGVLYDDGETPFSFSFSPGVCQFRSIISSSFPRTTPRFEQVIPAGRSGWLKLGMQTEGAVSGAALNFNANAGTQANAFNQGHNLHKLTLTTATTLTVPIFPPSC